MMGRRTNNFASADAMYLSDELIKIGDYYATRLAFPDGADNPPVIEFFCRDSDRDGVPQMGFFSIEHMRFNPKRLPIVKRDSTGALGSGEKALGEILAKYTLTHPLPKSRPVFSSPMIHQKTRSALHSWYYIKFQSSNLFITGRQTEFPLYLFEQSTSNHENDYYLTSDHTLRSVFLPYQVQVAQFIAYKMRYMFKVSRRYFGSPPFYYYESLDASSIVIIKEEEVRGMGPKEIYGYEGAGPFAPHFARIKDRLSCFREESEPSYPAEAYSSATEASEMETSPTQTEQVVEEVDNDLAPPLDEYLEEAEDSLSLPPRVEGDILPSSPLPPPPSRPCYSCGEVPCQCEFLASFSGNY